MVMTASGKMLMELSLLLQVTDFAWSHDGRMALICYRDGFVLVGSVAGQRYWSSMLNLDGCTITCGIWSPDDAKVNLSLFNCLLSALVYSSGHLKDGDGDRIYERKRAPTL